MIEICVCNGKFHHILCFFSGIEESKRNAKIEEEAFQKFAIGVNLMSGNVAEATATGGAPNIVVGVSVVILLGCCASIGFAKKSDDRYMLNPQML